MGALPTLRNVLTAIIVVIVLLHASGLRTFEFLRQIEDSTYVSRMFWSQPSGLTQKVVFVAVDDPSLNDIGSWPWPSSTLHALVDNLTTYYHAQAIGLDLVSWQPTTRDTIKIRDDTPQHHTTPIVLGYHFTPKRIHGWPMSTVPIAPAPVDKDTVAQTHARTVHAYYGSSPFDKSLIASYGFVNTNRSDPGAMVQSVPLFQKYRGEFYEALPVAMLRVIYNIQSYSLDFAPENVRPHSAMVPSQVDLEEAFHIPIDLEGNAIMPSPAYASRVRKLSALDIMKKNVPLEVLENRIVIIGVTTPNLVSLPERVQNASFSQSALHANLLANILDRQYKPIPNEARSINLLIILMLTICLLWTYMRLRTVGIFVVTGLCLLSLAVVHDFVWSELDQALPMAEQIVLFIAIPGLFLISNLLIDITRKRDVATLFRHSVSPEVVSILSRQKRVLPALGETRKLSMLSCSIRGYRAITEKTSPYQLARLTNQYLQHVNSSLFRHRGTLDHFRYDHVTAFWGAPLRDSDHASNAVAAALDIQSQLPILNRQFLAWGWKPIRLGIGLHSGQFNIANFGPASNSQYNIYGDEMNITFWLEQLSKHYGVNIIVSEAIRSAAKEYRYIELDRVRYSRTEPPVSLFEPIILASRATPALDCEIHAYHEALESFRARQWSVAKKQFSDLIVHYSGRLLYQMYLSRCYQFEQKPPRDEWDGVVFHPMKPSAI